VRRLLVDLSDEIDLNNYPMRGPVARKDSGRLKMEFKSPYLCAMREQAPKMFREPNQPTHARVWNPILAQDKIGMGGWRSSRS
jgi:hypothetical protein